MGCVPSKQVAPAQSIVVPTVVPASQSASINVSELKALEKCTSLDGMIFDAKVVDVYDGDTITFTFMNKNEQVQYKGRMAHYDSPEMKPLKTTPDREKHVAAAYAARDALRGLILDKVVRVQAYKNEKYGRTLIDVFLGGVYINQWMVDNKYGVPYEGGTKQPF